MGHEDRVQEDVEVLLLDPIVVILVANRSPQFKPTTGKVLSASLFTLPSPKLDPAFVNMPRNFGSCLLIFSVFSRVFSDFPARC